MNKRKRCTTLVLSYIFLNYRKKGIKQHDMGKIIKLKKFKHEKFTNMDIYGALEELKRSFLIYEPERDIIKIQPWVFDLKKPKLSKEIDYIG